MTFQKVPTLFPPSIAESTEDTDFLDAREFSVLHKIVLGIIPISLEEQLSLGTVHVDTQDVSGRSALHWASMRGDVEKMKLLVNYGANVNLLTQPHWSPFHDCATSFNPKGIELLLRARADVDEVNNRGDSTLSIAALVHGDVKYLEPLHAYGANINSRNDRGELPLHRAALRNNGSVAEWLVEHQAHIDVVDNLGRTPFHTAIISCSSDVARILVSAGCKTNTKAKNGRSPLHDAAAFGDAEMLWGLATSNLDMQATDLLDDKSMTVMDYFNRVI